MAVPTSIDDLSTTIASNSPAGTDAIGTSLDDYIRSHAGIIKQQDSKGSDIASGSTITVPNAGKYFVVTGTTTIAGINDCWDGRVVYLKFSGALTITHSSALQCPGDVDMTIVADDVVTVANESTGVWRVIGWMSAGSTVAGQQTIWVPAAAMVPRITNGPARATEELATNDVMVQGLDFDASTKEAAQFGIQMPKSWNESTVIAQVLWKDATTAGTGNVIWGVQGTAYSDNDAMDAAFGTAQEVTDAFITGDDLHVTSETSAITIGGTPAAEDYVIFQVYRDAADGSDTYTQDARLIGVKVHYTIDAGNDN